MSRILSLSIATDSDNLESNLLEQVNTSIKIRKDSNFDGSSTTLLDYEDVVDKIDNFISLEQADTTEPHEEKLNFIGKAAKKIRRGSSCFGISYGNPKDSIDDDEPSELEDEYKTLRHNQESYEIKDTGSEHKSRKECLLKTQGDDHQNDNAKGRRRISLQQGKLPNIGKNNDRKGNKKCHKVELVPPKEPQLDPARRKSQDNIKYEKCSDNKSENANPHGSFAEFKIKDGQESAANATKGSNEKLSEEVPKETSMTNDHDITTAGSKCEYIEDRSYKTRREFVSNNEVINEPKKEKERPKHHQSAPQIPEGIPRNVTMSKKGENESQSSETRGIGDFIAQATSDQRILPDYTSNDVQCTDTQDEDSDREIEKIRFYCYYIPINRGNAKKTDTLQIPSRC